MPGERLESWKDIAVYLRRGVRTVRRWEKEEGLPVHRHVHRTHGTVYAYAAELDRWRDGRRAPGTRPTGATGSRRGPRPSRVLVAVLPFQNPGGQAEQEYIADGLTDEMISELGRFNPERLGVIARTSVMHYKGSGAPVRQIADALKVNYLMEGSVRAEGERVHVTAQLIDARDETQVWAGRYEQSMGSILALQHALAEDIGREVHVRLSPARRNDLGGGGVHPEAYQAHLKGRYFLNQFTPVSVRRSVEYFQRAVTLDPVWAPAWASLAEAWQQIPTWFDLPAAATLPQALGAAERALGLDPDLPAAHTSMGLISTYFLWDWQRADDSFRRALALDPNYRPARLWYAEFLGLMGRTDEALATLEWARARDPLSRSMRATRAFALWLGRRFDEAIAEAEQVLEIDPSYAMALVRLGVASEGKGLHERAIAAFRAAERAAPELLACASLLGYSHARAGRRRDALRQLARLRRRAARGYVPAFLFATVHVGLGDLETAIDFMEQTYRARGWYLVLLNRSPLYDALRADPRGQALIRRLAFPAPSTGSTGGSRRGP